MQASRLGSVQEWRRKYNKTPMPIEAEKALDQHFAALNDLLEGLGHRPFGELELRMPGNAFGAEVIYRWVQR